MTDRTYSRCCFGSDDRDCHALLTEGHVDQILRLAIGQGLDPVRAIRMATWNPADFWRMTGIGAVAPGYAANLVVLNDLPADKRLFRLTANGWNGNYLVDLAEQGQLPRLFALTHARFTNFIDNPLLNL